MFINGGTEVAHAQLGDPDLCIGRPIEFQSPSVHGKDSSKPSETHTGERRWYTVGYRE